MRYTLNIEEFSNGIDFTLNLYDESGLIGSAEMYTGHGMKKNIVKIANTIILEEFRGKGFGKDLYHAIAEVYHQYFSGMKIARYFVSKKAHYLAKWCLDEGFLPRESWDDDLVLYLDEIMQENSKIA